MIKNTLQEQLGARIKKLRLNQGYSQEIFAEKINIATNTLSNIERGNAFMTSTTLEKIAEVLKISYAELFNFQGEQNAEQIYNNIIMRINLIKNNTDKLKILEYITENLV
ncbi:helix-turn-helix transcriptional regulator [bacterium]|nr:helix-turn-helix transcriptional regulator [bacterium]